MISPEWIHTGSILITIIATTYYVHRDIKDDMALQTARMDAQVLRTDKLYEMFIEVVKEKK